MLACSGVFAIFLSTTFMSNGNLFALRNANLLNGRSSYICIKQRVDKTSL